MLNNTVTKLVGSLSRAIGNELVSYEESKENVYVIKLWPPISQDNKLVLVEFIKQRVPRSSVRINSRKGLVTITLRHPH